MKEINKKSAKPGTSLSAGGKENYNFDSLIKDISTNTDNFSSLSTGHKLAIINEGIKKKDLKKIIFYTNTTTKQFTKYIHITERTLQNKKDNDTLSQEASERALLIVELYKKGEEVLGSKKIFKKWLDTENISLGGVTPESLLNSIFGIEFIRDMLGRIEYGMFA